MPTMQSTDLLGKYPPHVPGVATANHVGVGHQYPWLIPLQNAKHSQLTCPPDVLVVARSGDYINYNIYVFK